MFNSDNKKKNKIRLKRIISFFIFYSLISNNLLYASSMVISDNNREIKAYHYDYNSIEEENNNTTTENDNDTVVIDTAKPFKKISLNIFKLFDTKKEKIIANNSSKKIKSKSVNKEIEESSNVSLSYEAVDSEEFKYILSSIRENIMINKIINGEKFRRRLYNTSNLRLEEVVKLLEKSAKTIIMQESNKTKGEVKVRVLLYNQDNDVRGYSFSPNSNLETRIIGINIKNHNMTDSADLVETIFHESYDEKKHTDNEISAIRFGRYARNVWDTAIKVNKLTYLENGSSFIRINISDPRIEDATKKTEEIYKNIKKYGKKVGIFNEAKIMARVLDDEVAEAACKIYPKQCIPGSSPKQYRFVHYEIFFEDEKGGHIGFYNDGQIRPDDEANIGKYEYTIKKDLDDKMLRKAVELAKNEGIDDYRTLRHNCQHFIEDDVMPRYDHKKMIDGVEAKFGDKIGGIKDELGVGLGARPGIGFDNRPTGIGNGLGNGLGGIGNGLGNGLGGIGRGLNNGLGGIGNGLGNGPGGVSETNLVLDLALCLMLGLVPIMELEEDMEEQEIIIDLADLVEECSIMDLVVSVDFN